MSPTAAFSVAMPQGDSTEYRSKTTRPSGNNGACIRQCQCGNATFGKKVCVRKKHGVMLREQRRCFAIFDIPVDHTDARGVPADQFRAGIPVTLFSCIGYFTGDGQVHTMRSVGVQQLHSLDRDLYSHCCAGSTEDQHPKISRPAQGWATGTRTKEPCDITTIFPGS